MKIMYSFQFLRGLWCTAGIYLTVLKGNPDSGNIADFSWTTRFWSGPNRIMCHMRYEKKMSNRDL